MFGLGVVWEVWVKVGEKGGEYSIRNITNVIKLKLENTEREREREKEKVFLLYFRRN